MLVFQPLFQPCFPNLLKHLFTQDSSLVEKTHVLVYTSEGSVVEQRTHEENEGREEEQVGEHYVEHKEDCGR